MALRYCRASQCEELLTAGQHMKVVSVRHRICQKCDQRLQHKRNLPEAFDCLIYEQGLPERVALQVVENLPEQMFIV